MTIGPKSKCSFLFQIDISIKNETKWRFHCHLIDDWLMFHLTTDWHLHHRRKYHQIFHLPNFITIKTCTLSAIDEDDNLSDEESPVNHVVTFDQMLDFLKPERMWGTSKYFLRSIIKLRWLIESHSEIPKCNITSKYFCRSWYVLSVNATINNDRDLFEALSKWRF